MKIKLENMNVDYTFSFDPITFTHLSIINHAVSSSIHSARTYNSSGGSSNWSSGSGGGGGFSSGGGATSLVNYPIDDPLLSGQMEDRPMLSWIFEEDTYLERYH